MHTRVFNLIVQIFLVAFLSLAASAQYTPNGDSAIERKLGSYIGKGEFVEAEKYLDKEIEKGENLYLALRARADVRFKYLKKSEAALEDLDRVIKEVPGEIPDLSRRARIRFYLGLHKSKRRNTSHRRIKGDDPEMNCKTRTFALTFS